MKSILTVACLALFLIFFNCSENGTESEDSKNYVLIDEQFNNNTKVELFAEAAPFVGYNRLYVSLYDSASGTKIINSQVLFSPLMDMGTMVHSCPFENPQSTEAQDNKFAGSAIFIMSGMWGMGVEFHSSDDAHIGNVEFTFDVAPTSLVKKLDASDGITYFLTLMQPEKWRVGLNDLELCINFRQSMMSFPAKEEMTLTMSPWMDMGEGVGHGSPNNVNPQHTNNGHYNGVINYTMSGAWDINFEINNGDSTIAQATFEVMVE